jgi:hypothetical protein
MVVTRITTIPRKTTSMTMVMQSAKTRARISSTMVGSFWRKEYVDLLMKTLGI